MVLTTGSSAVRVDRVHLETETEWVPLAPVLLMCEITVDTDEEVVSVTWLHEGDPVYRWINNGTVLDMPENIPRTFVNDEKCTSHGGATLSRVHPKPIAFCYMMYTFSQFELKLKITDYPHGSIMWCYTYVYGATVDLLKWPPNEEVSCPVIDTPPPPQDGYNLTAQSQTPGCRHGIKADSSYVYTCSVNPSITVTYTCSPSGAWGPDLNQETWPTCAAKGKE
ncbi:hypothetical protein B566_EDAN004465 [Ephemera danica]|nr:hypothetical protein B566_EDAN004465 [Ephemera danica]